MTIATATVKMSTNGRILIPLSLRRALDIKPGDDLVLEVKDNALQVSTRVARLREAQEIARKYLAGKPSLADELIAERRAEAARE